MSQGFEGTALEPRTLATRELLEDPALSVRLRLVAGEAGLDRRVQGSRIQKSGLALCGHFYGIKPGRIQIFGRTELSYLASLSSDARSEALERFFALELCCVVMARPIDEGEEGSGVDIAEIAVHAERTGTPLLVSTERSSQTIIAVHGLLDDRLAPRVRVHGILVDVFGVGLLLLGQSGVGKSEAALDLVMRGHRLVADDVVDCDYRPPGMVFGAPADMLRYHLEVRGLGILNVKDLFGVTAIRERKRIDVVVRLVAGASDHEFDRLGLEDRSYRILGVDVPALFVPVRAGRNMASILEIAARNELLRAAGHHAGRTLADRIDARLIVPTGQRGGQARESSVPPALEPRSPAEGGARRVARPPASVDAAPGSDPIDDEPTMASAGEPTPAAPRGLPPESQAGKPPWGRW